MFVESLYIAVNIGVLCVCIMLLMYGAFRFVSYLKLKKINQRVRTSSVPIKAFHEEMNTDDLVSASKVDSGSIIDEIYTKSDYMDLVLKLADECVSVIKNKIQKDPNSGFDVSGIIMSNDTRNRLSSKSPRQRLAAVLSQTFDDSGCIAIMYTVASTTNQGIFLSVKDATVCRKLFAHSIIRQLLRKYESTIPARHSYSYFQSLRSFLNYIVSKPWDLPDVDEGEMESKILTLFKHEIHCTNRTFQILVDILDKNNMFNNSYNSFRNDLHAIQNHIKSLLNHPDSFRSSDTKIILTEGFGNAKS